MGVNEDDVEGTSIVASLINQPLKHGWTVAVAIASRFKTLANHEPSVCGAQCPRLRQLFVDYEIRLGCLHIGEASVDDDTQRSVERRHVAWLVGTTAHRSNLVRN